MSELQYDLMVHVNCEIKTVATKTSVLIQNELIFINTHKNEYKISAEDNRKQVHNGKEQCY